MAWVNIFTVICEEINGEILSISDMGVFTVKQIEHNISVDTVSSIYVIVEKVKTNA